MKYRLLGNTGLYVSELCLGTMTFGAKGFWEVMGGLQQPEVDLLVREAFDQGVNFFDTANVYSLGESEKIAGPGDPEQSPAQGRDRGCHKIYRHHERDAERPRPIAFPHLQRGRCQPQAPAAGSHRPVSTARFRPADAV